ncbi:MAG: hypothetical protein PVI81_05275 [Anaerolineales bacterium]|jgi:hypothetical protein
MKSLLKFLRTTLFTSPTPHSGALPIYVRCNRCGEGLKVDINLQNDLSVEYGASSSKDRYHVHKTIIGSNLCFQRIQMDLQFNSRKQIIAEEINGGRRIDKQEYERLIDGSALGESE